AKLAELAGVQAAEVLPFSTGVIGEQLPMERLLTGLQPALNSLRDDAWVDAATGIMTTDTTPKGASEQFELDGVTYTMTGISKGAGMIRPNMATMLGYVATDAPISRELVQQLLTETVNVSFNRITIDGDTSTNDSCIFIATVQAVGAAITSSEYPRYPVELDVAKIQVWLDDVQICKDGGAAADYTEAAGARVMAQAEMTIRVDLGRGQAKDTVYTCDLSYDYVKINADYRS